MCLLCSKMLSVRPRAYVKYQGLSCRASGPPPTSVVFAPLQCRRYRALSLVSLVHSTTIPRYRTWTPPISTDSYNPSALYDPTPPRLLQGRESEREALVRMTEVYD